MAYIYSWERKAIHGYNSFTIKKQKALALELYGKKTVKLAYCPEMIDRSGW